MDWTSGYRADIDYTHGYYRELSTSMIDFALLQRGFEPPVRGDEPIRYLELGYGQGVTLNVQAAASPGEYWGTDFNPVHANHAQGLARASGADLKVFDDSFAELAVRDDLPQFDYIVLHGIWTWVSDENRAVIVDILRRRLKVGGALYFSYNTLPGWAAAMPLRHLLSIHVDSAGEQADMTSRIDAALAFADRLASSDAGYFTANPTLNARLEALKGQNRNYLAHEYLNGVWTPMYFSQLQEWLTPAKLTYAAAGAPMDNLDGFSMNVPQRDILNSVNSDVLREGVRDYLLNTQFRRDVYVRGPKRLSQADRLTRLMDQRIMLTTPVNKIQREIQVNAMKVAFNAEIYDPIIEALAAKASPVKLSELATEPKLSMLAPGILAEAAQVLIGSNQASLAQDQEALEKAKPACRRLNAALCDTARTGGEISVLASPVIGAGVAVGRFEQLFLAAAQAGEKKPEAWARRTWETISAQGHALIQDGRTLEGAEANIAELTRQAKAFQTERLPLLKRAGVAD